MKNFLVEFFSVEDDLWKTTWQIILLPCTSLMLVLPQYNFYFYSSKLLLIAQSITAPILQSASAATCDKATY